MQLEVARQGAAFKREKKTKNNWKKKKNIAPNMYFVQCLKTAKTQQPQGVKAHIVSVRTDKKAAKTPT